MYKIQKLSNGLSLLTAPQKGAKTTAVLVMVATGSKYEDRRTSGLSHFLEHMFFKGTTKRPDTLTISTALDRVGGEYNAFTSKEYTGYWVKTAGKSAELALDVIADMLLNSKFEEEEIAREKGVIIEEVNMYLDNPIMRVGEVFEECLYGDTPAGWDTIGTKETINAFKRKDFVKYYQSQYKSGNSFVCLAGYIPPKVKSLVEKHFNKYPKGRALPKQEVKEKQNQAQVKLEYKKTDQAHLVLGVRTPAYGNPDYAALKMISLALGGSMSSRLFLNLRERNGLCYYVRSGYEAYTDTGYLATQAGVPVDKIKKAIAIIVEEYKKMAEEKISDQELKKIKQFVANKTLLKLEGADQVAGWYGQQLVMLSQQKGKKLKPTTPAEHLKKMKAVTPEDIQRVAKKIFTTKNLNLAIIGPYKKMEEFRGLLK